MLSTIHRLLVADQVNDALSFSISISLEYAMIEIGLSPIHQHWSLRIYIELLCICN